MATRRDANGVHAAGLVWGIVLVTFGEPDLHRPREHDLSSTQDEWAEGRTFE